MSASASQTDAQITEEQVTEFARAWYLALDVHAPLDICYTYLADDAVMQFPEATFDRNGFADWYHTIVHTFFDENHNVQTVQGAIAAGSMEADIIVVVGWQASWFKGPDAKSKRTSMNAYQRWTVRRSDKNQYGLEIVKYYVDRFEYAPGFAQL